MESTISSPSGRPSARATDSVEAGGKAGLEEVMDEHDQVLQQRHLERHRLLQRETRDDAGLLVVADAPQLGRMLRVDEGRPVLGRVGHEEPDGPPFEVVDRDGGEQLLVPRLPLVVLRGPAHRDYIQRILLAEQARQRRVSEGTHQRGRRKLFQQPDGTRLADDEPVADLGWAQS